jgi:hypothetical protein
VEKLDQPVNKTRYNSSYYIGDDYCMYQKGAQECFKFEVSALHILQDV